MEPEKQDPIPVPFADKPKFLQGFALMSCALMLAVTAYQVWQSVMDYLGYPTVITIDNSESASFPELVLCNNVPLSFTAAAMGMIPFKSRLERFALAFSRVEALSSTTIDVEATLHTLGRDLFKKYMGISQETLIFSCQLNDGTDCSSPQYYEPVDSPAYVNCFRFVINRTFTDVTFVLFSESLIGSPDLSQYFVSEAMFPLSAIAMDGSVEYDKSSGAVIYVKHKQFYMHPMSMLMVSTGQSSAITYKENQRLSINKQGAGQCVETSEALSYQMFAPAGRGNDSLVDYTPSWQEFTPLKRDCILRAMADYLENACKCRDPYMPIDSKRAALTNCRDVTQPNYTVNSACYRAHKSLMGNVSTSHCQNPCELRFYSTQVTSTKWPLVSNIRAMVNNVIRPRKLALEAMYGRKMYGLSYILQLSDLLNAVSPRSNVTANTTNTSVLTNMSMPVPVKPVFDSSVFDAVELDTNATRLSIMEKLSSTIASNFVKLQVRGELDTVQTIAESYKFTLSNVMSDIGGLLGLYLGWSVVTVFDLLHLMHTTFKYLQFRRSSSRELSGKPKQDDSSQYIKSKLAFVTPAVSEAAKWKSGQQPGRAAVSSLAPVS